MFISLLIINDIGEFFTISWSSIEGDIFERNMDYEIKAFIFVSSKSLLVSPPF